MTHDHLRAIDLSADFRLQDRQLWEYYYGQKHIAPTWIKKAVYGLPEYNRQAIKKARLIACPGCYPTSVILGLLPLLEQQKIDSDHIIANAVSGVSGAGRTAKIDYLLTEMSNNFTAYALGKHRHTPEMEQCLSAVAKRSINLTFVPHLLPIARGIHTTLYVSSAIEKLQECYEQRYANEPFVDVLPQGQYPQIRSVCGTNQCQISVYSTKENQTIILVAEDNLTKGASGQAIQNMNIMLSLDETLGLQAPALSP